MPNRVTCGLSFVCCGLAGGWPCCVLGKVCCLCMVPSSTPQGGAGSFHPQPCSPRADWLLILPVANTIERLLTLQADPAACGALLNSLGTVCGWAVRILHTRGQALIRRLPPAACRWVHWLFRRIRAGGRRKLSNDPPCMHLQPANRHLPSAHPLHAPQSAVLACRNHVCRPNRGTCRAACTVCGGAL